MELGSLSLAPDTLSSHSDPECLRVRDIQILQTTELTFPRAQINASVLLPCICIGAADLEQGLSGRLTGVVCSITANKLGKGE